MVAAYVRLRQKQLEREEESPSWTTEISLPKGFFSSDCQLLRRQESSNIDSLDTNPTRHGFFPFQTEACAFTVCYPPKSDDTDKEPDEMKIRIGSEANMRHVQPSV